MINNIIPKTATNVLLRRLAIYKCRKFELKCVVTRQHWFFGALAAVVLKIINIVIDSTKLSLHWRVPEFN